MSKKSPVSQAVANMGGLMKTAHALGLHRYQTVQQWIVTGQVPARYCVLLEAVSGVSRYELRPADGAEIWPELAKEPANV